MSSIALEDFVAEAKVFLDANAEPRSEQKFVWGEGPDRVGILDEKTREEEAEELRAAKDWKAKEFDAGFGWITGPEEYGGRALDVGVPASVRGGAVRTTRSRASRRSPSVSGWSRPRFSPTPSPR